MLTSRRLLPNAEFKSEKTNQKQLGSTYVHQYLLISIYSNANSLATLHQSGLGNALHMVASMFACVVRIICIAIEQSCYHTGIYTNRTNAVHTI